ncbi:polysaccharide deacetylase family protein [Lacinutrix jangbogonensis]|uniref:polysaccharide deacetylase family protein n=1 Tax=Lacinutrix jangbogonensis TaxID=1469557 RepID=UPI00053EFC16|nr:polysaccharide deacetylase family protein [Lacinutrix jangbogonensis]
MLWLRIKYRLRLLLNTVLFNIGFKKKLLKNRYGERILVFHGIDSTGETGYNSRFFSKVYFEKFIEYINKNYNVISLDDYYAKKFKRDTLNIAITFDDGYFNNYKYALPILKKHTTPASFYITTIQAKAKYLWPDFLDLVSFHTKKNNVIFQDNLYSKNKKNEFVFNGVSLKSISKTITYKEIKNLFEIFKDDWQKLKNKSGLEDYWKLISNEKIKEISNHSLFTIGAHGETHMSLINISLDNAKQEILYSKEHLETICEQPILEFAFPFGYYNDDIVKYCEDIGFKKILLCDYNSKQDENNEALKNRFVMNPYISMEQQLAYLLKGTYY